MKQIEKTLSEALTSSGKISKPDMEKYVLEAQKGGETLNAYLARNGIISEDELLKVLSQALNLETVDLKALTIPKAAVDKVPVKFAWYYKFMPVKVEGKQLTLAVSEPLDIKIQDEIRVHLGVEPRIVLAREADVVETLKKHYGLASDTVDRILTQEPRKEKADESGSWVEDIEKSTDEASVSKLVNQIILEAYHKRATDIHIEPYRNKVRFRYRIDGVLVDANLPAEIKNFLLPILSRIKIMANLSIVERRLPQDGSMVVKTKEQDLDLRVSTLPTPRGESMVIRILPTKVMLFSLEKLGLDQQNLTNFRELVKKPHGIILITGPTGSGKTTSLYACLNEINSAERKIITIEDPVEYEMTDITQIQVNPRVNLNFSTGLKSILRHDPDIIMVGEIRDLETAEIAIRTALTGHLVFSTLHTNDAASGVTRLIEMGLEPFLVASSVEAFVAQRLVRNICPKCKMTAQSSFIEIKEEIAASLNLNVQDIKISYGKGCDYCNKTGFYGRTAIYEVLIVNDAIRAAILEKPRASYIKQIAVGQGMSTLRQDGWRKVVEGLTTPAEVLNVTTKDEGLELLPQQKSVVVSHEDDRIQILAKKILQTKRNQRIFERILEEVQIYYKVIQAGKSKGAAGPGDAEQSAVTKDLSASGLSFSSKQNIPVDTILELRVHLTPDSPGINCFAKVCRSDEDKDAKTFNVAVYYLDISSADRVKINNFVEERLREVQQSSEAGKG